MDREIIKFASELPDGRPLEVEASITDETIIFKFKDARVAREMFFKEKSSGNQNVKYFERLNSFAEIHKGKNMAELKTEFIEKLKKQGLNDWTDVIAQRAIRKAEREKNENP